jgi:hypothetical protein
MECSPAYVDLLGAINLSLQRRHLIPDDNLIDLINMRTSHSRWIMVTVRQRTAFKGVGERVRCPSMVEHHAKMPNQPRAIRTQPTPQQQLPATSTWPSPPVDSLSLRRGLLLVPL